MRLLFIIALAFALAGCSSVASVVITPTPEPGPLDLVAAFKAAGLVADNPKLMEPTDYGLAPALCKGVKFDAEQHDNFGKMEPWHFRAFVCDDPQEQAKLKKWYDDLQKVGGWLAQYTYVRGKHMVIIQGEYGRDKADKYGAALP